jgi:hypothetical protein
MDLRTPLGTLTDLWRYPVKSLAAEPLTNAHLDERGLVGDRASALFVATPDRPRSGKTLRGKEQPLFHKLAELEAMCGIRAEPLRFWPKLVDRALQPLPPEAEQHISSSGRTFLSTSSGSAGVTYVGSH